MSTDLERRLAEALRRQADEVIAGAETQARHRDLMRQIGREARGQRWRGAPLHQTPSRDWSWDEPPRSGKRAWTVVVAAAAAVTAILAVSLPTLLAPQTTQRQTVTLAPEASALRVARDFIDAFASFDRERAGSLLADDAEVHIWATRTGEDVWRRGNRWLEAVDAKTILLSCQVTGASALGTLVECAFNWHTLHSEKLGYGPYVGGLFMFTVDDGKVVWVRQSSASDEFGAKVWTPFAEWVRERHPGAASVMYADWPDQGWESLSPRSIELWEELSREWVREQRR